MQLDSYLEIPHVSRIEDMESSIEECFFGAALMIVRRRTGMTRYQLAQKTGISDAYLNKLEHSRREPRARMILRIARGLEVSPGVLLEEMDKLTREYEATGQVPAVVREIAEKAAERAQRTQGRQRTSRPTG